MHTILYTHRAVRHTLGVDSLATAHQVAGCIAHALTERVEIWLADKLVATYGASAALR